MIRTQKKLHIYYYEGCAAGLHSTARLVSTTGHWTGQVWFATARIKGLQDHRLSPLSWGDCAASADGRAYMCWYRWEAEA